MAFNIISYWKFIMVILQKVQSTLVLHIFWSTLSRQKRLFLLSDIIYAVLHRVVCGELFDNHNAKLYNTNLHILMSYGFYSHCQLSDYVKWKLTGVQKNQTSQPREKKYHKHDIIEQKVDIWVFVQIFFYSTVCTVCVLAVKMYKNL